MVQSCMLYYTIFHLTRTPIFKIIDNNITDKNQVHDYCRQWVWRFYYTQNDRCVSNFVIRIKILLLNLFLSKPNTLQCCSNIFETSFKTKGIKNVRIPTVHSAETSNRPNWKSPKSISLGYRIISYLHKTTLYIDINTMNEVRWQSSWFL